MAPAETDTLSSHRKVSYHNPSSSLVSEFDGNLKIHLVPEAKDKILIRLENLADLFDGAPEATPMFNIH